MTQPQPLKQTAKIQGSIHNSMMANNASLPEVGKGATQLHWSDRDPYEVLEVSKDGKSCTIQALKVNWEGCEPYSGYANITDELTSVPIKLVYKWKAWRVAREVFVYTDKWLARSGGFGASYLSDEQNKLVYGEQGTEEWTGMPIRVVEGITYKKMEYNVIKILFGSKSHYRDPHF